MKDLKVKSITIFWACLLLSGFPTAVIAHTGGCGTCRYWNGSRCVNYGDCRDGCGCCDCVSCWCDAGECGPCVPCKEDCSCDYDAYCNSDDCLICDIETDECVLHPDCDPDLCKECDGQGHCVYQCDHQTQVCCDGVCTDKCEPREPTGQCDTGYNEECIGCTVFPYSCSDFKMREYTGNEVHDCTGGCPDDCVQQDAIECYVEYECKGGITQGYSVCGTEGEGVACRDFPELWLCTPCVKNNDRWVIEYAYPTECQ